MGQVQCRYIVYMYVVHVFRCGCLRFESPVWKCVYGVVGSAVRCLQWVGGSTYEQPWQVNKWANLLSIWTGPKDLPGERDDQKKRKCPSICRPMTIKQLRYGSNELKTFLCRRPLSWVGRSDYWHDYLGICSADGLRVDCVYSGICTTMCDDEGLDVEEVATEQRRRQQMCLNVEIRLPLHGLWSNLSVLLASKDAHTPRIRSVSVKEASANTWLVNVHTDPLSCLIYWK